MLISLYKTEVAIQGCIRSGAIAVEKSALALAALAGYPLGGERWAHPALDEPAYVLITKPAIVAGGSF